MNIKQNKFIYMYINIDIKDIKNKNAIYLLINTIY